MIRRVSSGGEVVISRAGAEAIPVLEPLWVCLHNHRVEVAPHLGALGPVRNPRDSWKVRAALYQTWLTEPDAFVMLAEQHQAAVGYAMVRMHGPDESWRTGSRIGELETMAVLPNQRGHGVGTLLIGAVYSELRRIGVQHLGLSVLSTSKDAIRFYERLGLLPYCVSYLGNIPPAAAERREAPGGV
jgi:ribosomal protein S18 acetylase RimI-like enzyme